MGLELLAASEPQNRLSLTPPQAPAFALTNQVRCLSGEFDQKMHGKK